MGSTLTRVEFAVLDCVRSAQGVEGHPGDVVSDLEGRGLIAETDCCGWITTPSGDIAWMTARPESDALR